MIDESNWRCIICDYKGKFGQGDIVHVHMANIIYIQSINKIKMLPVQDVTNLSFSNWVIYLQPYRYFISCVVELYEKTMSIMDAIKIHY